MSLQWFQDKTEQSDWEPKLSSKKLGLLKIMLILSFID